MRITVSLDIDSPLAWRWYAVDHVRNHPRWEPDMEMEQISPGPLGLGTRIRRRDRHLGQAVDGEMELGEWEPERAMGTRIRDANMDVHGRVTFEQLVPDRTRLTIDADFPGIDGPTARRLRPLIERDSSEHPHAHGVGAVGGACWALDDTVCS